jgi:hypothetical protein
LGTAIEVKGGDSLSLFLCFRRLNQRKKNAANARMRTMVNAPSAPPIAVLFLVRSALLFRSEVSAARAEDTVESGGSMTGVIERLKVVRVEITLEEIVEVEIVVRLKTVTNVVTVEVFIVTGGGRHGKLKGSVQLKGTGSGGG